MKSGSEASEIPSQPTSAADAPTAVDPSSPGGGGAKRGALAARAVGRPLFWVAFVALVAGWPVARALLNPLPPPLPILGTLPEFQLVDQHGMARGAGDVRGRVWVAGFVFTRCPSVCPAVTARMLEVQHRAKNLGESFRLVSFSVDPSHDTPEVLERYAEQAHARQSSWLFLTGDPAMMRDLVVNRFKLAVVDSPGTPEQLQHDTHLVLVDQVLRIRGYYDSTDPAAIDRMLADAGLLANRGR